MKEQCKNCKGTVCDFVKLGAKCTFHCMEEQCRNCKGTMCNFVKISKVN